MQGNIDMISQVIKCSSGLEFNVVGRDSESISKFIDVTTEGLFSKVLNKNRDFKKLNELAEEYLYEIRSILGISYVVFTGHGCLYILGPFFTTPFSKTDALITLSKHGLTEKIAEEFVIFCKRIPVVQEHTVSALGIILSKHLRGLSQELPYKVVEFRRKIESLREIEIPESDELTKMRRIEMRYENSAALTEAVKQGNFSLAVSIISKLNFEADMSQRNKNPLRNIQNYCIVINTQLRHAIESKNIHPYMLDKLSGEIGLKIEGLQTLEEANRYMVEIIRKYCDLVKDSSFPNLKPLVNLAVTYIKSHLADNLSVKEVAKILSVNADYLSNRFVCEMGMSFTEFVNRERVIQAEGLLKNTGLPIGEIASFVGYNNISYFAKQFSKFFSVTPSQYRSAR